MVAMLAAECRLGVAGRQRLPCRNASQVRRMRAVEPGSAKPKGQDFEDVLTALQLIHRFAI